MKTNIFANSYQQPENKLTYAFLSTIEYLNSNMVINFLVDNRIEAREDPIADIRTVYSGYERNPDGSIQVYKSDGNKATIFLEVKSKRRPIDIEHIKGHIKNHVGNNDFLLFISTSRYDCKIAEKIDKRIITKTWGQIANYYEHKVNDRIAKQFVRYGKMRAEFIDDPEITAIEIEKMISYLGTNIKGKMTRLFQNLVSDSYMKNLFGHELNPYYRNDWGREGIEWGLNRPVKKYKAWYFFGLYHSEDDHEIPFKKENIPEIAFFLDIDAAMYMSLMKNEALVNELSRLEVKGFELNRNLSITNNKWRLLFYRKPLDEVKELTENSMRGFCELVISLLALETNLIIKKELFI